jgi:hypothetical protein
MLGTFTFEYSPFFFRKEVSTCGMAEMSASVYGLQRLFIKTGLIPPVLQSCPGT